MSDDDNIKLVSKTSDEMETPIVDQLKSGHDLKHEVSTLYEISEEDLHDKDNSAENNIHNSRKQSTSKSDTSQQDLDRNSDRNRQSVDNLFESKDLDSSDSKNKTNSFERNLQNDLKDESISVKNETDLNLELNENNSELENQSALLNEDSEQYLYSNTEEINSENVFPNNDSDTKINHTISIDESKTSLSGVVRQGSDLRPQTDSSPEHSNSLCENSENVCDNAIVSKDNYVIKDRSGDSLINIEIPGQDIKSEKQDICEEIAQTEILEINLSNEDSAAKIPNKTEVIVNSEQGFNAVDLNDRVKSTLLTNVIDSEQVELNKEATTITRDIEITQNNIKGILQAELPEKTQDIQDSKNKIQAICGEIEHRGFNSTNDSIVDEKAELYTEDFANNSKLFGEEDRNDVVKTNTENEEVLTNSSEEGLTENPCLHTNTENNSIDKDAVDIQIEDVSSYISEITNQAVTVYQTENITNEEIDPKLEDTQNCEGNEIDLQIEREDHAIKNANVGMLDSVVKGKHITQPESIHNLNSINLFSSEEENKEQPNLNSKNPESIETDLILDQSLPKTLITESNKYSIDKHQEKTENYQNIVDGSLAVKEDCKSEPAINISLPAHGNKFDSSHSRDLNSTDLDLENLRYSPTLNTDLKLNTIENNALLNKEEQGQSNKRNQLKSVSPPLDTKKESKLNNQENSFKNSSTKEHSKEEKYLDLEEKDSCILESFKHTDILENTSIFSENPPNSTYFTEMKNSEMSKMRPKSSHHQKRNEDNVRADNNDQDIDSKSEILNLENMFSKEFITYDPQHTDMYETENTELCLELDCGDIDEAEGRINREINDENSGFNTVKSEIDNGLKAHTSKEERLNKIREASDNIAAMQENLQDMFREAKSILGDYKSNLEDGKSLKESETIPDIENALSSLSGTFQSCENVTGNISSHLHDIRSMTGHICQLIEQAEPEIGFSSDVPENSEAEEDAQMKEHEVKVKEARARSATLRARAISIQDAATKAELEASEAEIAAVEVRQEIQKVMKRAALSANELSDQEKFIDEVLLANTEVEKDEVVTKSPDNENTGDSISNKTEQNNDAVSDNATEENTVTESVIDKIKEKQQVYQKEILDMQFTENKLAENENELAQNDSLAENTSTDISCNESVDLNNPLSWTRHIYSIEPVDFNTPVGVILRIWEKTISHEDIQVTRIDPFDAGITLSESEELVSNILCISSAKDETVLEMKESISVCIPYCSPRLFPGKELVVKIRAFDDRQLVLPTQDVYFEDIKELKFVEVQTKIFGTMGVFLRVKKERLVFNRKGCKVMSSADSRITLSSLPGAFKHDTSFTLEVRPVEQSLITDLRNKMPEECGKVISSGPIITMTLDTQALKPITVTLPCPPNPVMRQRRPRTSTTRSDHSMTRERRPATAVESTISTDHDEDYFDQVHLYGCEANGHWAKMDIEINQTKKKDVVTFDTSHSFTKITVIRARSQVVSHQIERVIGHIQRALTFKPVSLVLRQKSRDPSEVMVVCSNPAFSQKVLKSLRENNYDHGPDVSEELLLKEGQKLELRFRGNLQLVDKDVRQRVLFNNYIPFRLKFNVKELDKYSQKGFDSYRGFAQIYTTGKVRVVHETGEDRDKGQKVKEEYVDGDIKLWEQLIILPKPEPEKPQPLILAPVTVNPRGVVSEDFFRFLANSLQYSDWKRLAMILNIRRSRIQAILRQNISNDVTSSIYDMLVTWSKRLPRSLDRSEILGRALASIGRLDLSDEVMVRQENYNLSLAEICRESHLEKAFVAVARHPLVAAQWKKLGQYLEIPQEELVLLETSSRTSQERCLTILQKWKTFLGDKATVSVLAGKLRSCRYRKLARDIENNGQNS